MATAKLKLADYSTPLTRSPDALYFERRCGLRRRLRGRATAIITQPGRADQLPRLGCIDLHDESDTGLGAFADTPIPLGHTIALYLPDRGLDFAGTVVRCEKAGERYSIGIRLPQRLAA